MMTVITWFAGLMIALIIVAMLWAVLEIIKRMPSEPKRSRKAKAVRR